MEFIAPYHPEGRCSHPVEGEMPTRSLREPSPKSNASIEVAGGSTPNYLICGLWIHVGTPGALKPRVKLSMLFATWAVV